MQNIRNRDVQYAGLKFQYGYHRLAAKTNFKQAKTATFWLFCPTFIIFVEWVTSLYPRLLSTGTGYPINSEFSYINQGQACPRRSGDKPSGIKRVERHYPEQLVCRELCHITTGFMWGSGESRLNAARFLGETYTN